MKRPRIELVVTLGLLLGAAPARTASTRAVVTTTAYGISGNVTDVGIATPWTAHKNVSTTASDAVIRYYSGKFYVVNRFGGDNIQVLDPSNNFNTVLQFSVGPGSNPHDIAFVSPTKAYVSRYDSVSIWIVNPQTGAHTGSISLASLADADGNPEMDQMVIVNRRLFVSLQILDRNTFTPAGPGKIAVIDVDADTLIDCDPLTPGRQAITLTGSNPTTALAFNASDHRIYVGETGNYGVQDGGIEGIDPVALTPGGFSVREDSLGGDVNAICLTGGSQGYAVLSDPSFNTPLVRFNLATHRKTATPYAPSGFVLADVEADDHGQVWISDRSSGAPGLRIFDAATGAQKTGSPIDVGLPPNSIAFDWSATADAPAAAKPAGPLRVAPESSIFSSRVAFRVSGIAAGHTAGVRVMDAQGRVVRDLGHVASGAEVRLGWDGAGSTGAAAPSGVYWITVEDGSSRAAAKVVLVR